MSHEGEFRRYRAEIEAVYDVLDQSHAGHEDALVRAANLARAFSGQGRHADAERILHEVQRVRRRVTGAETLGTNHTVHSSADCLSLVPVLPKHAKLLEASISENAERVCNHPQGPTGPRTNPQSQSTQHSFVVSLASADQSGAGSERDSARRNAAASAVCSPFNGRHAVLRAGSPQVNGK